MKPYLILLILLICITSVSAVKQEGSSYTIYHYYGSGVQTNNLSTMNVSRGIGQNIIGELNGTSYKAKSGIHYIYNLTLSDLTAPTLSVYSPLSTSYSTNSIVVNYSATDNVGVSSLYYYNGTANTTRNPDNITLADGSYTFYFYANDTSGNLGTASVSFTISTAVPVTPGGGGGGSYTPPAAANVSKNISICPIKPTIVQRLRDTCKYNNSVCEDAEDPLTEDCKLTSESLSCKGDRCVFKELWLFKILLIILLFLLVFYKKDYNMFIIIIVLFALLTFGNLSIPTQNAADFIKFRQVEVPQLTDKICDYQPNFIARLQDKCSYNNSICEDGENPLANDYDCQITTESVGCKGARCIFKEMWFAKLLILLGLFILVYYKKDHFIWVAIIGVVLLLNFSTTPTAESIRADLLKISPNTTIELPSILKANVSTAVLNDLSGWGKNVMPSNPTIGICICFVMAWLVIKFFQRIPKRRPRQ